ncbi:hypothetical protein DPEC_G00283780 [Dallia pectoralis]|uniref:Uncharacterized protein n=1 Tax=Dallia pectoralis TaxID=75939 RepID=A0ACC2FJ80_DALPE|nr:hypothetical protein DPEC_G00283780 [Dallia pectoralis]
MGSELQYSLTEFFLTIPMRRTATRKASIPITLGCIFSCSSSAKRCSYGIMKAFTTIPSICHAVATKVHSQK